MPRFRAIRPVRIDSGVQIAEVGSLGLETSVLELEAAAETVEWMSLAQI